MDFKIKDYLFYHEFFRSLLYLHMVYFKVFCQITKKAIFLIFCVLVCMLECVTIRYLLLDGILYAWIVQVLENNHLNSIQFIIKEMLVIPTHYTYLEFL